MAKKPVEQKKEKRIGYDTDDEKLDKVSVISSIKKMNKKYGKVASVELKQRDPYVPRAIEAKLRKDLLHMKAITANDIAARYDIRVSSVKKLLLKMEEEGIIECIADSSRIKIFNPVQ